MSALPSVTVSILTLDGERYLERILSAIERQDYPGPTEILVVDSGSTDATLDIVAAHPAVRLHRLAPGEFGHGRTRNLVAELATGELVVYLTHDAVPVGSGWLSALVAPLVDDERVAGVVGRQVARPTALPLQKYDIARTFAALGPADRVTITADTGQLDEPGALERAGFYSDVNSAARRSVLRGPVPYRDVAYAEDQLFGRDLLRAGLRKAYAPDAVVEHSNDLTRRELGPRIVEEVEGLRSIGTVIAPVSRLRMLRYMASGILVDARDILRDRDLTPAQRLRALLVNPPLHVVKWTSYRAATLSAVALQQEIPSS